MWNQYMINTIPIPNHILWYGTKGNDQEQWIADMGNRRGLSIVYPCVLRGRTVYSIMAIEFVGYRDTCIAQIPGRPSYRSCGGEIYANAMSGIQSVVDELKYRLNGGSK